MTDKPSPEKLLALGMSFWNAKALLSAVELGVFDALAEGPADLSTLRASCGCTRARRAISSTRWWR